MQEQFSKGADGFAMIIDYLSEPLYDSGVSYSFKDYAAQHFRPHRNNNINEQISYTKVWLTKFTNDGMYSISNVCYFLLQRPLRTSLLKLNTENTKVAIEISRSILCTVSLQLLLSILCSLRLYSLT